MADFYSYAPRLRKWEGNKFVCDPDDYGGATKGGVTLTTFREVFGKDRTVEDLKNMTEGQWQIVMKDRFWNRCRADQIHNQSVAEIFVDWCVHAGLTKIKFVQEMVGTTPDGIVGPRTIAAINAADQEALHRSIKLTRAHRFLDQIDAKSSQMKYFNGWFRRLADHNFSE